MKKNKREKRKRRHERVRAKIKGTAKVPRLCVFRSNKHIYSQLIDDEKGKTLVSASDLDIKTKTATAKTQKKAKAQKDLTGKAAVAYQVGQVLVKKALDKKLEKVVFDRGGHKYHGRIKALAEGAREGGLKF